MMPLSLMAAKKRYNFLNTLPIDGQGDQDSESEELEEDSVPHLGPLFDPEETLPYM